MRRISTSSIQNTRTRLSFAFGPILAIFAHLDHDIFRRTGQAIGKLHSENVANEADI